MLTAALAALALAAASDAPAPGEVHHNARFGFWLTAPSAAWRPEMSGAGDGVAFLHAETGARIDAWGAPALDMMLTAAPRDSLDALAQRIGGVAVRRGVETFVPLAASGTDAPGDPVGVVPALAYEGEAEGVRFRGVAATRCGVDYFLVVEAPAAAFPEAEPAYEALFSTYALDLYGGEDAPCGAAE